VAGYAHRDSRPSQH